MANKFLLLLISILIVGLIVFVKFQFENVNAVSLADKKHASSDSSLTPILSKKQNPKKETKEPSNDKENWGYNETVAEQRKILSHLAYLVDLLKKNPNDKVLRNSIGEQYQKLNSKYKAMARDDIKMNHIDISLPK